MVTQESMMDPDMMIGGFRLSQAVNFSRVSRAWMRTAKYHGLEDDAWQVAAMAIVEKGAKALASAKPLYYMSGVIGSKIMQLVLEHRKNSGVSLSKPYGKKGRTLAASVPDRRTHDESDPFDMIAPHHRELVRDSFYTSEREAARKHKLPRATAKRCFDHALAKALETHARSS